MGFGQSQNKGDETKVVGSLAINQTRMVRELEDGNRIKVVFIDEERIINEMARSEDELMSV